MLGRATLTIETSSTTMNWAMQAMERIIQSGAWRCVGASASSLSDIREV
jgi:hypothetical protein